MFEPSAGERIEIEDEVYAFASHPAMPRLPYGQEGREAVVYKLDREDGRGFALKVFKPRYRRPQLVRISKEMASYAHLPGMEVCQRRVIYAGADLKLLRKFPDLVYSALMPWIEGPTWMEYVLGSQGMDSVTSLETARSFLQVLVSLEEEGLSHGDLSGANVMLPMLNGGTGVALVDMEQLYIPGTERPEALSGGSPGYRFPGAKEAKWGPLTDRFPGSLILAEMLGFSDERVRRHSYGESYFAEDEIGTRSDRFLLMFSALEEVWGGEVATLFSRNWHAENCNECLPFVEWLIRLPDSPRATVESASAEQSKPAPTVPPAARAGDDLEGMLLQARKFESDGEFAEALHFYRVILRLDNLPAGYLKEVTERYHALESEFESPASPATIDTAEKIEIEHEPSATEEPGVEKEVPLASVAVKAYCSRCGKRIPSDQKFCVFCSRDTTDVPAPVTISLPADNSESVSRAKLEEVQYFPLDNQEGADSVSLGQQSHSSTQTARAAEAHERPESLRAFHDAFYDTYYEAGMIPAAIPVRRPSLTISAKTKKALLAASVFGLIVIAVLFSFFALTSYLKTREITDGASIVAKGYLDALRSNQKNVAWSHVSEDAKRLGEEAFRTKADGVSGWLEDCTVTLRSAEQDGDDVLVTFSLEGPDLTDRESVFRMVKEGDSWKVSDNLTCEPSGN